MDLWQAWTLVELKSERNKKATEESEEPAPEPPKTLSQIRGLVKSAG